MEKIFFVLTILIMVFASCKKDYPSEDLIYHLPTVPSNPNPPDNAVNLSVTTLSWTASTDAAFGPLSYDVYLSPARDGGYRPSYLVKVDSNLKINSYTPNALDGNTMYYWKIIATDNTHNHSPNYIEGPIWSFTTAIKNGNINFNPNIIYGQVKDYDGNIYKTVKIGNQEWMAENLRTTHTNTGDLINITSPVDLDISNTWEFPYQWACNGNENNVSIYGRLYNCAAIYNICPIGWHIPSNDEWTILVNYLGGESVAGGKLKESGTDHWNSPNASATNESGFTAIPSGIRFYEGNFGGIETEVKYFSSTYYPLFDNDHIWYMALINSYTSVYRNHCSFSGRQYSEVMSVRCVKD